MKNRDEMVNSLLERRDKYVAQRKRKRTVLARAAMSVSCACIVALCGFGMWRGGIFSTQPEHTAEDAIYPGIKDNFDESKGEAPNKNKIVINSIENASPARELYNLIWDDFVEMTREQMIEYYGVNYIPDVPADLKPSEDNDDTLGIFKRNGGTGEVYFDRSTVSFSNGDLTRTVSVSADKLLNGWSCYIHFDEDDEKSVINNVELNIGKTEDGFYYALVMHKNVSLTVEADGLTEDEFIGVVSSLLEE